MNSNKKFCYLQGDLIPKVFNSYYGPESKLDQLQFIVKTDAINHTLSCNRNYSGSCDLIVSLQCQLQCE